LHSALQVLLGVAQSGQIIEDGHAGVFAARSMTFALLERMGEGSIEAELMIASNHDLVAMGQCSNPGVKLLHLLQLAALGKIAGMYEYIAIWYIELDVGRQGVRVGHANHSCLVGRHRGGRWLHCHLDHALRFANLPPSGRGILAKWMYWHFHFDICNGGV